VDIHKNARLTPVLREELAQQVLYGAMMLSTAAAAFNVSIKTAAKWVRRFQQEGCAGLIDRSSRPHCSPRRLSPELTDDDCKILLFSILHRPPKEFGINRTSWRLDDLHRILQEQGHAVSQARIRRVIKGAGFKWRKAKIVLTSTDPDYSKKIGAIKKTLATIRNDEAFFSIDEYGPFAIKKKGGRKMVGPGEHYVIPQWQRSKGWLILTAALELSSNRVIHFYSRKKNTDEMIRMADLLRSEYRSYKRIYLSWDAASWHISKKLKAHLEELNCDRGDAFPVVETAPLPAGAQFLNIIESVFSGMARAIIHNSDYPSVEAATNAIDQYFQKRNEHFAAQPSRAGRKIWSLERTSCEFSESNNCKDPSYR
jgi:transposase/ribosomal protein S17